MDKVALLKMAAVKSAAAPANAKQLGALAKQLGLRVVPEGASPYWKKVLGTLGLGATVAATGVGVSRGIGSVEDVWSRRGKKTAFTAMLGEDSELKRMHKNNPRKVQSHFNTLFRFNPEMAKDPLVASSFVKGTAAHDYLAHKTVQDLIKSRKDLRDITPSAMGYGSLNLPEYTGSLSAL